MSKEATRRRILDAVVSLHEEVGPADTTISAIAERAGVQRLTVYRHFPDERALIHGCSTHWSQAHPPPDSARWIGIEDPRERLETALISLYSYFDEGREMLSHIIRDERKVAALEEVMKPYRGYLSEMAAGLSAGWGSDPGTQPLIRAATGHAVRFETWRSLADEGLSNDEAAWMMGRLVSWMSDDRVTRPS